MPVEIEAKIKVDEHDSTIEKLKAAGGREIGEVLETNVIFDTEDRSLLAGDKGLRVRRAKDAATGAEICTVTHKGPRRHGALKSRDETEMKVESFTAAIQLLERLRFVRVLSFEKRRRTWELDGCEVELDELPHLGCFVEIEGGSEAAIQKVREILGLARLPIVKTAYVGLMMTFLQDRGESGREVRFGG